METAFNKYRIEMLTDPEAAHWVHEQYKFNQSNCICGFCFGILPLKQGEKGLTIKTNG